MEHTTGGGQAQPAHHPVFRLNSTGLVRVLTKKIKQLHLQMSNQQHPNRLTHPSSGVHFYSRA